MEGVPCSILSKRGLTFIAFLLRVVEEGLPTNAATSLSVNPSNGNDRDITE